MAFADEKDGERREKSQFDEKDAELTEKTVRRKKRPAIPEVGHALRSAYELAVSEKIPPEMLDLLGKLD